MKQGNETITTPDALLEHALINVIYHFSLPVAYSDFSIFPLAVEAKSPCGFTSNANCQCKQFHLYYCFAVLL